MLTQNQAHILAVEPTMPGGVHFLDPFCYRCPFGQKVESCRRECIDHLEEVIKYEGQDKIAAIIMEGVVGSNGLIVPPDDYWPRVRQICDKHGILLISDEVMSGWGRTGKWFAVDHWNVKPDMITTAKGITSGYAPLGVVIVTDKIAQYFDDKYLYAGLTYNGHALSCAAALATIEVYTEDHLIENAVTMGNYLGECLEDIKSRHESVGDVRYIGLFTALELVSNRQTKEIFAPSVKAEIGSGILMICTLGGLGIWYLYDVMMIASGQFTDAEGRRLIRWDPEGAEDALVHGELSQEVLGELEALRREVAELSERMDFTERLLQKPKQPPGV